MVSQNRHEQSDSCDVSEHSGDRRASKHSWLTVPNAISVLRLLLVVPLCWSILAGSGIITVVLLAVWASTDWIDGALARILDQVSRAGEMLDPLADRIGIVAILVTMAAAGIVPWWMVGIIIVVDAFVAVATSRSALAGDVHVTWLGKIRTGALMVGMVGLVAATALLPNGHIVEMLAFAVFSTGVALHVPAGWGYLRQARRATVRASRRSPR